MKRTAIGSIVVAAMVGAFYSWVARLFWGTYVTSNPVVEWLMVNVSPREHHSLYLLAVYSHDVVLNIVLAAPFAALLILFIHQRRWPSLAAAVLSSLVVSYWGTEWDGFLPLASRPTFWIGVGMTVLSLPIAFLAVQVARRRWNHV